MTDQRIGGLFKALGEGHLVSPFWGDCVTSHCWRLQPFPADLLV